MTKPTITIHNTETDEYITREMNEAELAQWEIDKANYAIFASEQEKKIKDKENALNKLAVLGLTPAEIQAIIK